MTLKEQIEKLRDEAKRHAAAHQVTLRGYLYTNAMGRFEALNEVLALLSEAEQSPGASCEHAYRETSEQTKDGKTLIWRCDKCGHSRVPPPGPSLQALIDSFQPMRMETGASGFSPTPSPIRSAELLAFIFATVNAVGDMVTKTEAIDAIQREWNATFGGPKS